MGKSKKEVLEALTDDPVFTEDESSAAPIQAPAEEAQPAEGNGMEKPSVSPTEKDPAKPAADPKAPEAKEEPLPFHKNARWLRMQRENEELNKAMREQSELLKQLVASQKPAEVPKVPDKYKGVFGDDVPSYQQLVELAREEARLAAKADREEYEKSQKEAEAKRTQAETDFMEWANGKFAELSDEAGVDLTQPGNALREKILDIIEQNELYTPDGKPNLKAGLMLHKLQESQSAAEGKGKRQAIAGATSAPKSGQQGADKGPMTPKKLRGLSIENFFN